MIIHPSPFFFFPPCLKWWNKEKNREQRQAQKTITETKQETAQNIHPAQQGSPPISEIQGCGVAVLPIKVRVADKLREPEVGFQMFRKEVMECWN